MADLKTVRQAVLDRVADQVARDRLDAVGIEVAQLSQAYQLLGDCVDVDPAEAADR